MEDEVIIREVVRIELEDAGYEVVLAANADAAIAILEARADIHLVFTDIDMPGSMESKHEQGRSRQSPPQTPGTLGGSEAAVIQVKGGHGHGGHMGRGGRGHHYGWGRGRGHHYGPRH